MLNQDFFLIEFDIFEQACLPHICNKICYFKHFPFSYLIYISTTLNFVSLSQITTRFFFTHICLILNQNLHELAVVGI